jgi:hypothetical protein
MVVGTGVTREVMVGCRAMTANLEMNHQRDVFT